MVLVAVVPIEFVPVVLEALMPVVVAAPLVLPVVSVGVPVVAVSGPQAATSNRLIAASPPTATNFVCVVLNMIRVLISSGVTTADTRSHGGEPRPDQ